MIEIVEALDDPNLFGPWFSGPSWATWKAVLKAAFALPMDADDLKLFRAVAERDPPRKRVRELWAIVGRRGGKDSIASAIACYSAAFVDYGSVLRPGEAASIMCLAVDKSQADVCRRYAQAYFSEIALLRGLVRNETADGVVLTTKAELSVLASNFRNVRGRSIACCVMDEVAFWRSETTANPDVETYQALVPSLATIPGSLLVGISTPYRRAGLLWQKHRDYFGQNDDDVLIVHGGSRLFNPTLPQAIIDDALKRDPAAARAEWEAQWRDDVSAFLSRELIESAVDRGVVVRAPEQGIDYHAFADPSGGISDSLACAIAHRDADGRAILDCLHETVAPFDPAQATAAIAKVLKAYGVTRVVSDKYAAQWPVSEFSRNDITLEHSERDRSAIYADFLPLLTSGRARLLDNARLVAQCASLERRASPMGRDRIDHPVGAHDDLANAASGACVLASDWSSYDNSMDWVGGPTVETPAPSFNDLALAAMTPAIPAGPARSSTDRRSVHPPPTAESPQIVIA
jgi:hypothetical protein